MEITAKQIADRQLDRLRELQQSGSKADNRHLEAAFNDVNFLLEERAQLQAELANLRPCKAKVEAWERSLVTLPEFLQRTGKAS